MSSKNRLKNLSRRDFLGCTAKIASGTLFSTGFSCASSKRPAQNPARLSGSLPDSKFSGVQIGAITYSFRDLKGGVEEILKACVDAGISSVELMGTGIERYMGAPQNPVPRRPTAQQPLTGEEQRSVKHYMRKLEAWRNTPETLDAYAQLRKKFNDAGVSIHFYKWTAGNSEEELEYSFSVAKALGAIGITAELNDDNARLMGPVAERRGMYAVFHNHFQYAEPGFDVDKLLSYSPANKLNFDIGHYYGSTGLNPADFIRRYHHRIASVHLKDKTGPDNPFQKNTNQVWGQGETPLEEVLRLIRDQKWPIYCDIELEYPVAPWSDSVKEVKTCMEYCRQILV